MSHLLDELKARRSVRKYQARPLPQELIREVLLAAGWAPSAHNAQPWRFIVLVDPKVKRRLAVAMAEAWRADMVEDGISIEQKTFNLRTERFATAPTLVVACLSMTDMAKFSDEKRQKCERDLAMQSLAAAVQNMLLAAHSLGLGACWFCAPAFCKETVRQVLKIPVEVEPEALVAIGYPAEKPPVPSKKPFGDYCFVNQWGIKQSFSIQTSYVM